MPTAKVIFVASDIIVDIELCPESIDQLVKGWSVFSIAIQLLEYVLCGAYGAITPV
ncbi:MAG: hypothetical protein O2821_07105 [Chloroflexi bacterium]|nr:hypothetical protein [Chloroflexota bacterium]MDA1228817.1 hypothetical protein [Chloroflexota bacterium]